MLSALARCCLGFQFSVVQQGDPGSLSTVDSQEWKPLKAGAGAQGPLQQATLTPCQGADSMEWQWWREEAGWERVVLPDNTRQAWLSKPALSESSPPLGCADTPCHSSQLSDG